MSVTKRGFTLAEVLVTLGIIGVVSAITVPALTQNWQRRAYVTQLHKVYNIIQQAFAEEVNNRQAINLSEAFLGVETSSGADAHEKDFLHEHFKVVKDCGVNTAQCFASTYRNINGDSFTPEIDGYKVSIAGGASVSMNMRTGGYQSRGGHIYVDTNGPKGPNIIGRDFFSMVIFSDGTLDSNFVDVTCRKQENCASEQREADFSSYCKTTKNTWDTGCFAKLLNDNWEMNY